MNNLNIKNILSTNIIKSVKREFKMTYSLKYNNFITNFVKRNFSTVYVNHRDTFNNNELAPFDFTEDNYKKVDEILVSIFLFKE